MASLVHFLPFLDQDEEDKGSQTKFQTHWGLLLLLLENFFWVPVSNYLSTRIIAPSL